MSTTSYLVPHRPVHFQTKRLGANLVLNTHEGQRPLYELFGISVEISIINSSDQTWWIGSIVVFLVQHYRSDDTNRSEVPVKQNPRATINCGWLLLCSRVDLDGSRREICISIMVSNLFEPCLPEPLPMAGMIEAQKNELDLRVMDLPMSNTSEDILNMLRNTATVSEGSKSPDVQLQWVV